MDKTLAIQTAAKTGLHLKRTRELKKISVSDVAAKLNVTKTVIDNLEAGAWDELKGHDYLTDYADFLGLSSAGLWAQFEQGDRKAMASSKAKEKAAARVEAKAAAQEKAAAKKAARVEAKAAAQEKTAAKKAARVEAKAAAQEKTAAKKAARAEAKITPKKEEKATDKITNEKVQGSTVIEEKGLLLFKPVLFILLMLVAWFAYQQWQGKTQSESLKKEIIAAISEIESITVEPLDNNKTVIPRASERITEKSIGEKGVATTTSNETVVIITPEPLVDNKRTTLDTPNLRTKVVAIEERSASETIEIKQPLQSRLVLGFGGRCLVNVKDATGKVLMNNVKQLGDHSVLVGKPPIRIALGNVNDGNCWVNMEDASNEKNRINHLPVRAIVGDTKGVVVTFDGTSFDTQPSVNP